MNFYIWEEQGFYAPGYTILVDSDLENLLEKLKDKKEHMWYNLQGIGKQNCILEFVKYIKENNLFEDEVEIRRQEIMNDPRNGKPCIDFHKTASYLELVDRFYPHLPSSEEHKKFIDDRIVNNRSPWFLEPQIKNCEEGFFIRPAW